MVSSNQVRLVDLFLSCIEKHCVSHNLIINTAKGLVIP
jgi:hypothetical protein